MSVAACSFVTFLWLDVLLCIWMLHRVALPIRVSSQPRQRLQLLRTRRHLNVRFRLRALIDEAVEEQQATKGREVSMGIENCRVLGTESGRVGPLAHGGSEATGVGQRAGSAVVMTEPLWLQSIRCLWGCRGDESLWRVPNGDACGSCCLGC